MSFVFTASANSARGSVLQTYADADSPLRLGNKLAGWLDPSQNLTVDSSSKLASWGARVGGFTIPAQGAHAPIVIPAGEGIGDSPNIQFDGTSQYLLLTPVPSALPTGSATGGIAVCARNVQTAGAQTMVAYGQGAAARYLGMQYTGRTDIKCTGGEIVDSSQGVNGAAHAFLAEFGPTLYGFIDGNPTDPPSASATPATSGDRLVIGTDAGTTPTLFFQGVMTDIFFLKGAPLTTDEIALLNAYMAWRCGL